MSLILFTFLLVCILICQVFKKRCFAMLGLILVLLLVFLIGGGGLPKVLLQTMQQEGRLTNPNWGKKNVIILLSGGTAKWLNGDEVRSSFFVYSRVHEAARLYFDCRKMSSSCSILVSGGDPRKLGVSEAEVMQKELLELSIPANDIGVESKSLNTYQNAKYSSALLLEKKLDEHILVTSGGHIKRATLFFTHFGLRVKAAPSDQARVVLTWLPQSSNFLIFDLMMHEYIGILQFYVYNQMGWNK